MRSLAVAALLLGAGGCHLVLPLADEPPPQSPADLGVDESPPPPPADLGADAADASHADTALIDQQPYPPVDVADGTAASCTCQDTDLNGDGFVDQADLDLLTPCLGVLPLPASCQSADFNKDGDVDGSDLACFSQWKGKACP
jgi:hypothetical protein